jgi:hypothetical protein
MLNTRAEKQRKDNLLTFDRGRLWFNQTKQSTRRETLFNSTLMDWESSSSRGRGLGLVLFKLKAA